MTKVLVFVMNSRRTQRSFMIKLYGDPEQYVYKLANDTFADKLPIQMNWLWKSGYGFFGSITLDQKQQKVWFGNNVDRSIQFGRLVYKTSSYRVTSDDAPMTNQVLQHY